MLTGQAGRTTNTNTNANTNTNHKIKPCFRDAQVQSHLSSIHAYKYWRLKARLVPENKMKYEQPVELHKMKELSFT